MSNAADADAFANTLLFFFHYLPYLGGVAKYSWYIPKFTAKSNPLLLSHFGINAGLDELENRRIMAETFLRPQTFQYFCNYISKDNCTTPYYDNDGRLIISGRPPLSFNNDDDDSNSDEGDSYFVRDVYHGHFSATNENNCTKNPTMCTGHLSNVQCDWSTFAIPQAYYNNIPVKGSGPDDRKFHYYMSIYIISCSVSVCMTSLFSYVIISYVTFSFLM